MGDEILSWLLEGDPAIRWQVLRDLVDADDDVVEAERQRVATEGWGARLLAEQDPDGKWAGAIYSPKWVSTTYTLLLLHWLGLPGDNAQALAGCRHLWEGVRYVDGVPTPHKIQAPPDACVTAMFVLLASRFGYRDPRIENGVEWLLGQQMDDGGWNCERTRTRTEHGSFHTTISTLDAFVEYERAGGTIPIAEAAQRGRDFFLAHRLYRSHRTGEVANPAFAKFPFPPQWHFEVMRGLEHFATVDAPRDERLGDAVDLIRRAQRKDGTWPGYTAYSGRTWFRMEPAGPSRWNTLRALRVLRWWEGNGH